MKRLIFCASVVVTLCAAIALAQFRENICTNPGFEDWTDPGSAPATWRWFWTGGALGDGTRSTDVHEGIYAILFRWTNVWVGGMDSGLDKQGARLTVTEGHHYRIRFWAKGGGYGGENIGVRCAFYNGTSWIRDWPTDGEGGTFGYWIINPLTSSYTEYSTVDTYSPGGPPAHFIPDATANQCNIRFSVAFGPGSYLLDEIVVEDMDLPPTPTPTPTETPTPSPTPTPFGFAAANVTWTVYE